MLTTPRFSFSRAALVALLLLVAAGPARAQTWTAGPPMPTPRSEAAVAVIGGALYVIGGRTATNQPLVTVERFDPATETWSSVPALDEERFAAAAAVYDGRILLIGGREDDGDVSDEVESYVPGDDEWEDFSELERERNGPAAVVLGGDVFVLGGTSEGGGFLSSAERYDEGEEEWDEYDPWTLDPGRASTGAAALGDAAYFVGGFSQFGPLDLVERYEVGAGAVERAPLPAPRGGLALAATGGALGGDLFAIGGRDVNGVVASVTRYDEGQNAWQAIAPLQTAREGAVAAFLGGAIYVVGGRDVFGDALASMEVFGTATDAEAPAAPAGFALGAAYPNPFAGRVTLPLRVDAPRSVSLTVYDVTGRAVAVLVDGVLAPGDHQVTWDGTASDGRPLPSGVYVARVVTASGTETVKLTLLR